MTRLRMIHLRLLVMTVAVVLGLADAARAQQDASEPGALAPRAPSAATSGDLDPREIDEILLLLEDEARRNAFVADLRKIREAMTAREGPDAHEPQPSLLEALGRASNTLQAEAQSAIDAIVDLPSLRNWAYAQTIDETSRGFWLDIAVRAGGPWLVGVLALYLVRPWLRGRLERLRPAANASIASITLIRVRRTLAHLAKPLVFGVAGGAALWLSAPPLFPSVVARSLLAVTVTTLVVLAASRIVLSLNAPELRIAPLSDSQARETYGWTRRIALVAATIWIVDSNTIVLNAPVDVVAGVERLLGLILVFIAIALVLRSRRAVAAWIAGEKPPALEEASDDRPYSDDDWTVEPDAGPKAAARGALASTRKLAAWLWPAVATVYIVATYLVWAFEFAIGAEWLVRGAIGTVALIALIKPVAQALERMLGGDWRPSEAVRRRYPTFEKRVGRYRALLERFAFLFTLLGVLFALTAFWGLEPWRWPREALGEAALSSLFDIFVLCSFVLVAWELVSFWVETRLQRRDERGEFVETNGRVRTLLPLARTLFAIVLLAALATGLVSALGLDPTPLLAAAGAIGVAVGFGSQKLIQDFVTGAMILIHDTFSVGDVIEISGRAGVVESISIRAVELRDLEGNVHTLPFSEVGAVKNYTRHFAHALFDVKVARGDDVEAAMALMEQCAAELDAHPEMGEMIAGPLEMFGVDRVEQDYVVVRARIKTGPGCQWAVRRAFSKRLGELFDAVGMRPPYANQVMRHLGEDMPGPPMRFSREALGDA